jgi:hypothetical protein
MSEATTPSSFRLSSTIDPVPFGSLAEISDRSRGCTLCDLILRSVYQDDEWHHLDQSALLRKFGSAVCFLTWKVDGRNRIIKKTATQKETRDQPGGLTRRIHLRWSKNLLKDSYLVFVGSDERLTASDAERAWNSSLLFLGRTIGNRGHIQARMKSWIDLCLDKHRGPCFGKTQLGERWELTTMEVSKLPRRLDDMLSHSYFGVIDVLDMQLTELPLRKDTEFDTVTVQTYAALSYVWGNKSAYKTVLQNVMQHRMHGGLEKVFHMFPKAVQDAIKLVRQLGVRYLWIDALCIIQDSARSWKLNAYNMDIIYGNAIFTICAADGLDASTGLLAMDELADTDKHDQLIAACTEDVKLMISRPPEMYIEASIWNTRAWTFQERLLSRRCLIFIGGRVYFQCQSTGMSEDIYADREGAGWSLDFTDAPLQTFRQLSLRSIWVYMRIVELYTARSLTKQGDILAAFSGVANLMQQKMRAPFVFGLPTSHLDLALLWEHSKPVERREGPSETKSDGGDTFPSWSWTGWIGEVAQYRRDLSAGCLENVKEWLELRTWVRWYVRDDNGDLRPLWDERKWQVDASEHKIWQGYVDKRSSGAKRFWSQGDTSKDMRIAQTEPRRDDSETPSVWPVNDTPSTDSGGGITDQRHRMRHPGHVRARRKTQNHEKARPIHSHQVPAPYIAAAHQNPLQQQVRKSSPPVPKPEPKPTLPDRAVQSEPLPVKSSSLLQRLQALLRWLRDNYRREIVLYLIDICLSSLRLVTYLLGIPMHFTRSETPQYPRPSSNYLPHWQPAMDGPPLPALKGPSGRGGYSQPFANMSHPPPPPPPPPPPGGHQARPPLLEKFPAGISEIGPRHRHSGHSKHRRRPISPSSTLSRQRRVHDMVFEEDQVVEPKDTESNPTFRITLKEFPYQPVIGPFHSGSGGSNITLMPILQFWTWHSLLHIQSPPLNGSGLTRCNIADKFGDWCGSIVLDNKWLENTKTAKQEFIAISEAKKFTDEECGTWSYYIPMEREESEWDLFFVLLIAWSDGRWERVGLGKVFKEAFRDATWKEIVLA